MTVTAIVMMAWRRSVLVPLKNTCCITTPNTATTSAPTRRGTHWSIDTSPGSMFLVLPTMVCCRSIAMYAASRKNAVSHVHRAHQSEDDG